MKKIVFLIIALMSYNCYSQCLPPVNCNASNINYYNADVNWDIVSGSHHYKIRYKENSSATWLYKNNIDSIQSNKNLANLQPLSTYIWQIRTYCDSINSNFSSWSQLDTFITNTNLCPSPTNLNTTNITYYNALASWALISGADRYKVHYRIYGTSAWSNLGLLDSMTNSVTIPLLQQNTTYEWEVMAYFDSTIQMASLWSTPDTFTTTSFVAAPFNPQIDNMLSSNVCNTNVDLTLKLTQANNEPDIATSTITTDGGSFDIAGLSTGDTIGSASLITATQNIYAVLKVGMIIGQNYAIINSYDTSGGFIGFFAIENIANGVRVSSTSPNDGNNYTSGLISEVLFNNVFITPNYTGDLHIFSEIESELNDFINNTDTFSIECPNNISENVEKKILINKIDLQGRMLLENSTGIIIYIYSDGSIEKKLLLKKM